MADKPQPKRDMAFCKTFPDNDMITFYCIPDALSDIDEYGEVDHISGTQYQIKVSGLFDFDEVVEYIKNHG